MKYFFFILLSSILMCEASHHKPNVTVTGQYLNILGYDNSSDYVDLESQNIFSIDPNAFNGYRNLSELDLQGNYLSSIDLQVFSSITSTLQILDLRRNHLLEITNKNGLSLPNLRVLRFSASNQTKIDSSVIKALANLNELFYEYTSDRIESNQFSSWTNLSILHIHTKNQTSVNKNLFNGLGSLKELSLRGCNIKSVDSDSFSNLNNLKRLDLARNSLTSFDSLKIVTNLTYLDLTSNELKSLKFANLVDLKDLRLANNQFKSLKSISLNQITNLNVLYLENNPIENPNNLYQDFPQVKAVRNLFLERINMTTISASFFKDIANLTHLDLSGNMISKIEPGASSKQLAALELGKNSLTQINNLTFSGLFKLRSIDLTFNKIAKIESGAFNNLTLLEKLNMSYNQLQSLDKNMFAGLKHLKVIDVSNNPNLTLSDPQKLCPTSNCKIIV